MYNFKNLLTKITFSLLKIVNLHQLKAVNDRTRL